MRLSTDRSRPNHGRGIARRHGRRAAAAVAAVATIATMTAWSVGTPASAGGLLASTTLMGASIAKNGGEVVHTNTTVQIGTNQNGLGLTPSGTVYFTDDRGDSLGSVALPNCLLKPCTVAYDIPTSRFSDGVTRLTAQYSGDLLLKPSSATVALGVARCGQGGCWAEVTSGSAHMSVNSQSTTGFIAGNFGSPGLPCGVSGGGPVGHVEAVGLNDRKEIYYMLVGSTAAAYGAIYEQLDRAWFCYASPDPFYAWSQGDGSVDFPVDSSSFTTLDVAPRMGGPNYNGYYVGLLAYCNELEGGYADEYSSFDGIGDTDGPCLESYGVYQNSDNHNQWELYVFVRTPPGDPFLGGLKLPAIKLPGLG